MENKSSTGASLIQKNGSIKFRDNLKKLGIRDQSEENSPIHCSCAIYLIYRPIFIVGCILFISDINHEFIIANSNTWHQHKQR